MSLICLNEPSLELSPSLCMVASHEKLLHLVHLGLKLSNALLELQCLLRLRVLRHSVLDLLDSRSVIERVAHLTFVIDRWRAVDEHEGFGCTTERIFHQLRQYVITIWDELSILGKSLDDIAERRERDVDCICFFLTLLVDTGFSPMSFKCFVIVLVSLVDGFFNG